MDAGEKAPEPVTRACSRVENLLGSTISSELDSIWGHKH